jgi:hypothetical protein
VAQKNRQKLCIPDLVHWQYLDINENVVLESVLSHMYHVFPLEHQILQPSARTAVQMSVKRHTCKFGKFLRGLLTDLRRGRADGDELREECSQYVLGY